MDVFATLGALLGIGMMSGIRLYSTVLAVGLGIRYDFLEIPPALSHLDVLAQTPVLVIAAVVYTVEFLADKIPLVDSLWDLVHTFIRPVGAALLGAAAIGPIDPAVKVAVALACGFVAFSSHSAKATTRAVVNQSPEPFSNIGLSLGEDVVVAGGVWLALTYPILMFVLVVIAVGLIIWLVPKLFRFVQRQLTGAWRFATGGRA